MSCCHVLCSCLLGGECSYKRRAPDTLKAHEVAALMRNCQAQPDMCSRAGPTKVFLLVHGDFPDESIPVGFIFKRGFQIRMQKGLQVGGL